MKIILVVILLIFAVLDFFLTGMVFSSKIVLPCKISTIVIFEIALLCGLFSASEYLPR